MISARQLTHYAFAEPFRPFRIRTASGQSLEIKHPEMISVSKLSARIDWMMSDDPEAAKMGEREVSVRLMESVEPIDATFAQDATRT